MSPIAGIHHVTAIGRAPQQNIDFYVGVLGLRLVKRTVNFDDPGTYHLYYGDDVGRPGTAMTVFPSPGARPGFSGAGTVSATAFSAPAGSVDYWKERLAHIPHDYYEPIERFGERVLPIHDVDGLALEIVERQLGPQLAGWAGGPVPGDAALRCFDGVTLALADPEPTAAFLRDVFGYAEMGREDGRRRLETPAGDFANRIDLVRSEGHAQSGVGTVHHVAFRARDAEEQAGWRQRVQDAGLRVTDVRDRQYFRSIYFREPGGVLFEIATDGPGFTADESADRLGSALRLPPWLEPRRPGIERRLPEIAIPRTS
jgi:glyoxalase family protein